MERPHRTNIIDANFLRQLFSLSVISFSSALTELFQTAFYQNNTFLFRYFAKVDCLRSTRVVIIFMRMSPEVTKAKISQIANKGIDVAVCAPRFLYISFLTCFCCISYNSILASIKSAKRERFIDIAYL